MDNVGKLKPTGQRKEFIASWEKEKRWGWPNWRRCCWSARCTARCKLQCTVQGVQGAGGLQGARSASCWNKRNSSACSEPNYFCPDDNSRFFGKTYLVNKLPANTNDLWSLASYSKAKFKNQCRISIWGIDGSPETFHFSRKKGWSEQKQASVRNI